MNKQNVSLWASLIAIVIAIVGALGFIGIGSKVSSLTATVQAILPSVSANLGAASPNNVPHGYWNTGYGYKVSNGGTVQNGVNVIDQYGQTLTLDALSNTGGVSIVGTSTPILSIATTTPCSLESPAATSSLLSYMAQITTGTSTTAVFDIGYATTPYATTTLFVKQHSTASGAMDTFGWLPSSTSTPGVVGVLSTNETGDVIAPNTWVNLKSGVAAGGLGYVFGGTCSATFLVP